MDGQGTTWELLYHLATGAYGARIGVEPMTDNPMSSAHRKLLVFRNAAGKERSG